MGNIIIKDNIKNKEYKLEYNRYALIQMEEKGFDIKEYEKKPLKSLTILIRGAFIKNHPEMKDNEIDDLISQIGDTEKLVEALAELYADAMNSIVAKKGNENSKNITWGKN